MFGQDAIIGKLTPISTVSGGGVMGGVSCVVDSQRGEESIAELCR